MRLLLLIMCFIFSFTCLRAQNDFVQAGAEWHYDMTYGSFRQYVHSDTVINGISCKRIKTDTYVDSLYFYQGLRIYSLSNKYIYSSNDTVYAYNSLFGRFTPLYIFNVQPGDTITLPVQVPDASYFIPNGDSTFRLVIDSVKMELHDTALLKTVYTHPDTSSYNPMKYDKYTWNIGALTGLLPKCLIGCHFIMDDRHQATDSLRCYKDNRIAAKYIQGNCQKGISLSVPSKAHDYTISIHPNPATETVFITNNSLVKISAATITGLDGRVYKHYEQEIPAEISITDLAAGTYLVTVQTENGTVLTRRLVVMR
jgi:hypothetical protein